jgi:hypothetical protein
MGLILPQLVDVRIMANNYRYYESLGYKIPRHFNSKNKLVLNQYETIKIHVLDLKSESQVKVKVQCDYCGKIFETIYAVVHNVYNHEFNNNCACAECNNTKLSEIQNYVIERDDNVKPFYRNEQWLKTEYINKNRTAKKQSIERSGQ